MAGPYYLDSVAGSNANNGTTWALAKATGAGVAAIPWLAADIVYLNSAHSELTAGGVTLTTPTTRSQPVRMLSVNKTGNPQPPTAKLAGALIATSGASNNITKQGDAYDYGITYKTGNAAAVSVNITLCGSGNARQTYEACHFWCSGSGGSSWVNTGPTASSSPSFTQLLGCGFKFGNVANGIAPSNRFEIIGGSIDSGGVQPTNLFNNMATNRGMSGTITGFDGTNLSSSGNWVVGGGSNSGEGKLVFRDCKAPPGWSGSLLSSSLTTGGGGTRVEAYNVQAGAVNYGLWIEDNPGSIRHETTLVRTGGASDGTQQISWKMVTTANTNYPNCPLYSGEIEFWNDTVGSPVTATIEGLIDSATNLKDNQIWVELFYKGDASTPIATFLADITADVFATAADQATSTATWNTSGMANPNKFKLDVTFTPQMKGTMYARVCPAGASKTYFIDPVVTLH